MKPTDEPNPVEEFIHRELEKLSLVDSAPASCDLVAEIHRRVMSKRFRKRPACDALKQSVRSAVAYDVERRQPINITFLQGCYKLWRLDESPEADWAELFALMYYAAWVKPILAIYQPGVVFDFYLDDLIMERISNYTRNEIVAYQHSFQEVMDFVMRYCPENLRYKATTVSSQYEDEAHFWEELNLAVARGNRPRDTVLDESTVAMVDLNYRPVSGEVRGAGWREEIIRIHDAHSALERRLRYREADGKILAMPQHYRGADSRIFVGSTKDSWIKYWVGVGALRRKDGGFVTTVLSPKQLSEAVFSVQKITVVGLHGRNFDKIRVLES